MSSAQAPAGAYKKTAASLITGVPVHTIDYWARESVLCPSIADTSGTGVDRLYSYEDLRILLVLRQAEGLSLAARTRIVNAMRSDGGASFVHVRLSPLLELRIDAKELHRQLTTELNLIQALYGKSLPAPAGLGG